MSEAGTPAPGTEPSAAAAARTRRERKAQAWRGRACENCGVALQGPFCHQCGQPEKTPIRNLLALSSDAFDYLFDVDARVYKTLNSLFFRPGRLTELYLAGQRMSFVRPLRIYLVVSALLFVVVSSMSDLDGIVVTGDGDIEVIDDQPAGADAGAAANAAGADRAAAEPGATAAAKGDGDADRDRPREPLTLTIFGDEPWHPIDNPLLFDWLPATGNQWLNDYIGIIKDNMELARDDPKRLGHAFLRVLPQSLFVLLPVFALLLKVVLVFKRRLYMEHLMVAIHSHTFIYLGILVAMALSWVAERWPAGWTNPWWTIMGVAIAWIPVNLFLSQKRVYRQRWWGAPIAFSIIGTMYLCLIVFTAIGALVASLVNL